MQTSEQQTRLYHAVELIRQGNRTEAASVLKRLLQENPQYADAWYFYAATLPTRDYQRQALQRALLADPFHEKATKALERLNIQEPVTPPPPAPPEPLVQEPAVAEPPAPSELPTTPQTTRQREQGMIIGLGVLAAAIIFLVVAVIAGRLAAPPPRVQVRIVSQTPLPTEGQGLPGSGSPTAFAALVTATPTTPATPTPAFTQTRQPTRTRIPTATPNNNDFIQREPDPPTVPVIKLADDIIDMSYSNELDRLVYITKSSAAVYLYNLETGKAVPIELPRRPASFSVKGTQVAIGHQNLISLVDLKTGAVVATYEVAIRVLGLLLSSRGWIYTSYLAINIQTSEMYTMKDTKFFNQPNMQLYLSPSETDIYAAEATSSQEITHVSLNDDGSPSNKIVINNTDYSRYGYSDCRKFWVSPTNGDIILGCGITFSISPKNSPQLVYEGTMFERRYLRVFDIVDIFAMPDLDQLAVLTQTNIYIFKESTLDFVAKIQTPFIFIEGTKNSHNPPKNRLFCRSNNRGCFLGLSSKDEIIKATLPTPRTEPDASTPMRVRLGTTLYQQLPFWVIDAVYNLPLDRIVAVTSRPAQIVLLDPMTGDVQRAPLPRNPTSVSIRADGLFAAVSHDRLFTVVDLKDLSQQQSKKARGAMWGIAYADDGRVYLGLNTLDTVAIDIYDPSTDSITEGWKSDRPSNPQDRPYFTALRLSPAGDRLFGWGYEDRLSITVLPKPGGLPEKPLVDRASQGGLAGISEDGKRIFGASGETFRVSDVAEYNGELTGSLEGTGRILSVAHSKFLNRIVAIRARQVNVYDGEMLYLIAEYPLPVLEKGREINNGFVFFNAARTHYVVILSPSGEISDRSYGGIFSVDR